ncbi:hypothetical protein ABT340_39560 [Streptosporangium sp. NPDC000239]|uniref:hypothetical protein n=1 Tax=Streptosporangium sp. NPDC000239 TaxID=3154248 RepID=UPI003319036A
MAASGFVRPFVAEYTTGSFASTPATQVGAITVGETYTVSLYLRSNTFNVNSGSVYVEWVNAGGTGFGYPSAVYSVAANTVTRVSVTAVAPTGAVAARVIVDGVNFPISPGHFTAVLIEPAASLDTYFDGDTSPGGSWDGAAGNSSSTLLDAVAGILTAALPTLDSAVAATATTTGAPITTLPSLTATTTGTAKTSGTAAISPDGLTVASAGRAVLRGAMVVALPELAASTPATGDVTIRLGPVRRRWSARTGHR